MNTLHEAMGHGNKWYRLGFLIGRYVVPVLIFLLILFVAFKACGADKKKASPPAKECPANETPAQTKDGVKCLPVVD